MNSLAATTGKVEDLKFDDSSGRQSASVIVSVPGEDTTMSTASKKPQFQFVCMEPTKDQPQTIKMYSIANKDNRLANLIDPITLSRILKLQSQQKSTQGTSHNHSGSYSNSQQQSNIRQQYNTTATTNQSENKRHHWLDIEKIGICGIPSLWVPRQELIQKGHLFKENLDEQERLELMLRVLQSHKKYENEKYFGGGSIFKRGSQGPGNVDKNQGVVLGQVQIVPSGVSIGNVEYVWFNPENLQKLKIQSQSTYDKGSLGPNKDEDLLPSLQALPHIIRGYDQPDALTFKIMQAEAKLVRLILESHGFVQTDTNDWNLLWTCTSSQQKQYIYENLLEYQKVNHFVNASELTRKDRLCFNVGKMQQRFGRGHFDFLPETYIIPDEYGEFQKQFQLKQQMQWDQESEDQPCINKNLWIIKPSSSSQGKGIFMVDDIAEVPQNESLVISKYIDNPLLINGLKFDLRLYVLVTNFDPLKIYVYNEGLVRFASEPYNIESIKSNVYAHLTNYSINKKSENFVQNKNISERDFGNKWSLSALQSHLERLGIDMKAMWCRIYDAIIKSLISVENQVVGGLKKVQEASGSSIKQNCFDLFGFDIILDSDLKPWILEVNLSPSLAFDSPLDFHIKSNLIIDALNIVGVRKFNRKKEAMGKHVPNGNKPSKSSGNSNQLASQISTTASSSQSDQKKRQTTFASNSANLHSSSQLNTLSNAETNKNASNIDVSHMERLSKISAKHRELLREHLEEFCLMRQSSNAPKTRKHNFTRIFPAPGTNAYDIYFQGDQQQSSSQPAQSKQWNKVLYRYLYDRSSEMQDILNQIQRQNQLLQAENQRKISQAAANANYQNQQSDKEPSLASSIIGGVEENGKLLFNVDADISQNPTVTQERLSLSPNKHDSTRGVPGSAYKIHPDQSSTTENVSIANKLRVHAPPRSQSSMSNVAPQSNSGTGDIDGMASSSLISTMKTINVIGKEDIGSVSPINHHNNTDPKKRSSAAAAFTQGSFTHNKAPPSSDIQNGDKTPNKETKASVTSNLLQSVEQLANGVTGRVPHVINSKTSSSHTIEANNSLKPKSGSSFDPHTRQEASQGLGIHPVLAASQATDTRIVVTGDDILIEYVRRIMVLVKQCHLQQIELSGTVKSKMEFFINHKIWHPKEDKKSNPLQQFQSSNVISGPQQTLWQKIEGRFAEMGDRKRRLFIKKNSVEMKKSEASHDQYEKLFRQQEKQKSDIVRDFSSSELELMLTQSNKNNPIEVVTLLLSLNQAQTQHGQSQALYNSQSNAKTYGGVLTKLESDISRFNKNNSQMARLKVINSQTLDNEDKQQQDQYNQNAYTSSTSKERQFQSSIINRLRASDDHVSQIMQANLTAQPRQSVAGTNVMQPQSSQSQKKDQGDQYQHFKNYQSQHSGGGVLGLQGATQIHNQNGQNQGMNSHTSLMANLQSNSHSAQKPQGGHLTKSSSKSKNQATFDRSDIALQTGLTLTHKTLHKLGNENPVEKQITLPQISSTSVNQNNQMNNLQQQFSSTGSSSVASHKGAPGNQGSSYLQQQTLQNLLTTVSGVTENSSKYRANKIQTSSTTTSGVGGHKLITPDQHNKYANLRATNIQQQQSLNNSVVSGSNAYSSNLYDHNKGSSLNLNAILRSTVTN